MNFPNIPKSTKSSVSQSQTNFYYNNQDNSPVIRPSTQEYYNTKLWKQAKPQLLYLQQLDQECDEQDKIVNNFNKTFENKQSYKSYLEQNFPFMGNSTYYGTNDLEKLQRKDFQKQINYSRSYQFIKNKGISQEQYKMVLEKQLKNPYYTSDLDILTRKQILTRLYTSQFKKEDLMPSHRNRKNQIQNSNTNTISQKQTNIKEKEQIQLYPDFPTQSSYQKNNLVENTLSFRENRKQNQESYINFDSETDNNINKNNQNKNKNKNIQEQQQNEYIEQQNNNTQNRYEQIQNTQNRNEQNQNQIQIQKQQQQIQNQINLYNEQNEQQKFKKKELDFEEIERRVQERKKKRMIKKNELTVEQLYEIRVKMLQELRNEENNVKKKFEVMNSIFEKELNIGKRKIYMQKMQEQKEKQRLEMLSRQQVFNSFTNLLALNNSQKNRILLKQQNRRKFEEMLEKQRQKNRRIKSQQQQESAEQEQNYLANSYLSGVSDNYIQQNETQNNQSIFGKQNNSQFINNGREYQLNRFLSQQNSQNLEQIVESEIDENDSEYVEGGSEIEGEDSQTDKIFSRFNNIKSPNYKNIQSKVKTGKQQIKIKNKNYSLQNSLSNSLQLKINKYNNDLGNQNNLQGIDKQIQIYKSKFKNAKF